MVRSDSTIRPRVGPLEKGVLSKNSRLTTPDDVLPALRKEGKTMPHDSLPNVASSLFLFSSYMATMAWSRGATPVKERV